MDEPCSALDPTSTRRIEETIGEMRDEVTIVIVTHNMQQAARVSQQCAFFLAEQGTPGGIVEAGATEQIFEQPARPADRGLRQRPLRLSDARSTHRQPPAAAEPDRPCRASLDRAQHRVRPGLPRHRARRSASSCWSLTGSIGLFLGLPGDPDLRHYGFGSSPRTQWEPELNNSASPRCCSARSRSRSVALVVAFPLAFCTALYISEYAPRWLRESCSSRWST